MVFASTRSKGGCYSMPAQRFHPPARALAADNRTTSIIPAHTATLFAYPMMFSKCSRDSADSVDTCRDPEVRSHSRLLQHQLCMSSMVWRGSLYTDDIACDAKADACSKPVLEQLPVNVEVPLRVMGAVPKVRRDSRRRPFGLRRRSQRLRLHAVLPHRLLSSAGKPVT